MIPHIVIIGNGISGITCARHIRKLGEYRITVISSETEHFYSRTALMYIYMGHMKYEHTKPYEDWFWEKNRIGLVKGHVEKVDVAAKAVLLSGGQNIQYDKLVIATGSKPNFFGWPGQELQGVQGMYSMPDLELMEKNTKGIRKAVIVGGGLIGIEMAEMLLSRNIQVTFLIRENSFWNTVLPEEESQMINRHIREHHVDLKLSTELKEIVNDGQGKVKAVVTKDGEVIECQFVGLTVGVGPNISFLKDSGIKTNRGVVVNHYFESATPDVYAIGDCAEFEEPLPERRAIEQVWYTGKKHGEALARIIYGERKPYDPGLWFNSAKFFDIEYHVYGIVPNDLPDHLDWYFWEEEAGKKCLRIVYEKERNTVVGIHGFGLRLRQEVCEHWITKKMTIDVVVANLSKANFDPEFSKTFHQLIQDHYKNTSPKKLVNEQSDGESQNFIK
jgi:NADPH-dependent 2,4-dienoyl-CoA reductase/sulfur reductase-like enzyme